jgi:hypothetical protein
MPIKGEEQFQFRIWFCDCDQPIEFVMPYEGTMKVLVGLFQLQVYHKIPFPPTIRPPGKARLSITKFDRW